MAVFIALSGPVGAQTTSDDDKGYLTTLLEENLSDAGREVRIEGFEGALSSHATFTEMTIADREGVWLVVRGAALSWSRSALVRGRVEVQELSADEIEILRQPVTEGTGFPNAEATPFRLPELPVSVEIGLLSAKQVTLGAPILGEEVGVSIEGKLSLSDGDGSARLSVLRNDGTDGALNLTGRFVNASRALSLDLQVREPAGGIAARLLDLPGQPAVDLTVQGDGFMSDFTADIGLSTAGTPRLSGQLTLGEKILATGSIAQLFGLDIKGDIAPLFLPEYQEFFGPNIQLIAQGNLVPEVGAELTEFKISAAQVTFEGNATVAEDGLPEFFHLTGRVAAPNGAPVLLPVSGVEISVAEAALDLMFDAQKGEEWSGTVDVTNLNVGEDKISQAQFRAEGQISPAVASNQISANLAFNATGVALAGQARAEAFGDHMNANAEISWVEGQPINISTAVVETTTARATLSGDIGRFEDGLPLTARGSASLPDIAIFSNIAGRPLTGRLVLGFNGMTRLLDGRFDMRASGAGRGLSVGIGPLDRVIGSQSRVALDVARDETGINLRQFDIETEGAKVTANGFLRTDMTDLSALVRLDQAGVALPGLDGPAELRAKIKGNDPGRYTLFASGEGPGGGKLAFDGVLVESDTKDLSANGKLVLSASDLSAYGPVTGLGLRGAFETEITGSAAFTDNRFDVSLEASGDGVRFGIRSLDQLLGTRFTLATAARREGTTTRISQFELKSDEVTADAIGVLGRRDGRIEGRAVLRDLAIFAPDFPGALDISGALSRRDDRSWGIDIQAKGPGGTVANVVGNASEAGEQVNLKVQGEAPLGLANAAIAPRAVRGRAGFDLVVNGPPRLSSMSGRINTSGVRLVAPTYGAGVNNISGQIVLGNSQARVDFSGAVDGGGRVNLSGNAQLSGGNEGQLRIALADAYFTDGAVFESTVSGEISVTGPLSGGALVGGSLVLGETNVRVAESGAGAGGDLPGLVHLNEPYAVRLTRLRAGFLETENRSGGGGQRPYRLDLLISAPGRIFVRGRGLDAELGGSLRLRGTTSKVLPQGEFSLIRGRLDILGRRLALDEGYARLEGSFDPYIRLVATTETDEIVASIIIEGPASEPEIRFESIPELPEDEVLARLFFGRSLAELSAFQALRLASAIATLSGRGGTGVVERLRQKFGLDDFDITTDQDGNVALKAGKYISENVYTEVRTGAEGKTDITINLDVSPSVTVRGSVGTEGETGIGVFFEKDY